MKKGIVVATVARPVDFETDCDLECAILGKAGWHSRAIARETGLTENQVTYRLGRAGIRRADYRNGTSEMAHFVLSNLRQRANLRRRIAETKRFSKMIDDIQEQCIISLEEKRLKKAA